MSLLFVGQLFSRIERQMVCPIGVIKQFLEILKIHSYSWVMRAQAISPAIFALFLSRAMFAINEPLAVLSAICESKNGVTDLPVMFRNFASLSASSITPLISSEGISSLDGTGVT